MSKEAYRGLHRGACSGLLLTEGGGRDTLLEIKMMELSMRSLVIGALKKVPFEGVFLRACLCSLSVRMPAAGDTAGHILKTSEPWQIACKRHRKWTFEKRPGAQHGGETRRGKACVDDASCRHTHARTDWQRAPINSARVYLAQQRRRLHS